MLIVGIWEVKKESERFGMNMSLRVMGRYSWWTVAIGIGLMRQGRYDLFGFVDGYRNLIFYLEIVC